MKFSLSIQIKLIHSYSESGNLRRYGKIYLVFELQNSRVFNLDKQLRSNLSKLRMSAMKQEDIADPFSSGPKILQVL